MKQRPVKYRHKVEFACIKAAVFVVDRMPVSLLHALVVALGSIAYAADNRRRDVACQNLRIAGVCQDERSVRRTARAACIHFFRVITDALRANHENGIPPDYKVHVVMDPETEKALSNADKGIILCSGHLGNWEIGLRVMSGYIPVVGIARAMNNPLVEAFFQRRAGENLQITPKHDEDAGRLIRTLSQGRALALLFDQHASGNRGIMVDFFGKPASTYPSPAMLHLITGAPLCFGACLQTGEKTFELRLEAPIQAQRTGNRKQDAASIMQTLNTQLEAAIRRAPEQYLWAHRRWRE